MTVLTKNASKSEVCFSPEEERVLCVAINSGKMGNGQFSSEVNTKLMKYDAFVDW